MRKPAHWLISFAKIILGLSVAATLLGAGETDKRLGPDNPHGWGFFQAKEHDPALPNVLLMGDSIAAGYRETVVSRLRGRANVDVFLNPYHQASPELYPELAAVLAKGGPYAVIHFNMGLHGWAKGRIPEGQFEPLTRKLVSFLKRHSGGAKLIWASSTPVTVKNRAGVLDKEINPIIVGQNRLAEKIMGQEAVPVDDLYRLMCRNLELARGDQFHWTPPGSKLQGTAVADAILDELPSMAVEFFVAPDGNDANDGSLTRPFATLERARSAVREALRTGGPALSHGVCVSLRGGIYLREETFELGKADSGPPGITVTYRSFPNETARLVGGHPLLAGWFEPVPETSPVWQRLQPAARAHVLEIDLRSHGITQFGQLQPRGMHHPGSGAAELFVNGRPLPLAQWPKANTAALSGMGVGFSRIAKVVAPDTLMIPDPAILRWAGADQAWLHGYWGNLWADFHLPAASINTVERTVKLAQVPPYGMKEGMPFRVYNLLEEISEPGDWFLDRTSGKLYVWPTAGWAQAEIFLSTLPGELIAIKDAEGIVLDGLVLEMSWSRLVSIDEGSHNVIRRCVLRNCGTDAALIDGTENGITGCVIENTGECGVRLFGGSRAKLIAGGNFVRNSRLSHFSRWTWTYSPGIEVHGVGQVVVNNRLTDAPHSAILFFGNNHQIEFNDIHDVCRFSCDAGAIYAGRRWDFRGTKIRYNFIHDLDSPLEEAGVGENGVYLDDCLSGTDIVGNVFYRISGDAILCNGGRDNLMTGNIIIKCGTALEITAFGVTHTNSDLGSTWNLLERLGDDGVQYQAPIWASAYPRLAAIPDNWAKIRASGSRWLYPGGSSFKDNVGWHNGKFIRRTHVGDPRILAEVFVAKNNLEDVDPRLRDEAGLDFTLGQDSPAFSLPEFVPVPFAAIGPSRDPFLDP